MNPPNVVPQKTIQIDSGYWLDGDHARQEPRDPYLRWAQVTGFRSLKRTGKFALQLAFIVERTPNSHGWAGLRSIDRVTVPAVFDDTLATGALATFATVRVSTQGLTDEAVNQRLHALLNHRDVLRIQLGYPRGSSREVDEPDAGVDPRPPKVPARRIAKVLIGVIDDGCPFAHPDLRNGFGKPRLAALWQQTTFDAPTSPWHLPTALGYGRALNRFAMAKLMTDAKRGGEVDERLCYQQAFAIKDVEEDSASGGLAWTKPNRALLTRASHGGSVLAVAAGAVPALRGPRPACETVGERYGTPGDAASHCPLIFVDLPREQVEISSGRWLPINALDGLRFILSEARNLFHRRDKSPVPVVVNLSSGSTAGAHCGQAMLERAMDELLQADDRLAITLAAGNSRISESHAQFDVGPRADAVLGVFVPPSQAFDTFVEFWLPAGVDVAKVVVTVESPDGLTLAVSMKHPEAFAFDPAQVAAAQAAAAQTAAEERAAVLPAGDCIAALLFYPHVVQAVDRTMVLLAVCGTVSGSTRKALAAAGPWRVSFARSKKPFTVQAWIERDEVVYGTRHAQAARFFAFNGDSATTEALVRKTDTLSNIATGAHSFAVGAYRGPKDGGPVSNYSGAPPEAWQTRYLPFAARADAGQSHPGVRVPGNRGNVSRRMNGTSVAAPQAARFVANAMAAGKTRPEVAAALPKQPVPLPVKGDITAVQVDPRDGRLRL